MGRRSRCDSDDEEDLTNNKTKRFKGQNRKAIIKVYVDGSFWKKGLNKGEAKGLLCNCTQRAGYGIYLPGCTNDNRCGRAPKKIKKSSDAEFYAITQAIQLCRTRKVQVHIFTDCLTAVHISEKYQFWLKDGKKRKEHIKKMFEAMQSCTHLPKLLFVRGHSGDKGNDMADGLAKQGMRRRCSGNCV